MTQSLTNLHSSIKDIEALLDFSLLLDTPEQKGVVFRSAVVLLIASWEQYIEQLADSAMTLLTNRLRDSSTLPEEVKQGIAKFAIPERDKIHEFSTSVWSFADKNWKTNFINYSKSLTSKLNTASTKNIQDLYKNLLGIRDVTSEWAFLTFSPAQCVKKLDDMVDLRHDIAHGANTRIKELTEELLREQTKFILSLANLTNQTVFTTTAEISQTKALKYSLSQRGFVEIILFASQKKDKILTLREIKDLGSSAQGNHNKLCYKPWSLLEYLNSSSRSIPDKLLQFYNDEISLPMEILVFDNKESIDKPGTRYVVFSDLK